MKTTMTLAFISYSPDLSILLCCCPGEAGFAAYSSKTHPNNAATQQKLLLLLGLSGRFKERAKTYTRGDCMNVELDFEKRYRLVREIIETVVLTVLMFFVIRQAVQNFNIQGMSMEPSLHNEELILVDKWSYLFHAPTRGDVVVFVAPPHPDQDYIKRIIAVPGDTITINDTTVIVDGVKLHETYVDPHRQGNLYAYKTISNKVIPPDEYFVLGDNRIGSSDSRDWGLLSGGNIIGRAALVYWPHGQSNNGLLPNVSEVFANVHQNQAGEVPGSPQRGAMVDLDGMFLLILPPLFLVFSRRRATQDASRKSSGRGNSRRRGHSRR